MTETASSVRYFEQNRLLFRPNLWQGTGATAMGVEEGATTAINQIDAFLGQDAVSR